MTTGLRLLGLRTPGDAVPWPRLARALLCCRRGVTALEYGLIASLIGAAMITGATTMGGQIGKAYSSFAARLTPY